MTDKISLPREFTPPHLISGRPESASILVGFSGGADSSALLRMLYEYSRESGAQIYAAHINHGIRGDEADRDEQFCRETCDTLGIKLFVLRADLPAISPVVEHLLLPFMLLVIALMVRSVQVLMRRALSMQEESDLTV